MESRGWSACASAGCPQRTGSSAVALNKHMKGEVQLRSNGVRELKPAMLCEVPYDYVDGELCACASCEQVHHLGPHLRVQFLKEAVLKGLNAPRAVRESCIFPLRH